MTCEGPDSPRFYRGLLNGCALSSVIWAVIVLGAWWVLAR